MKFKSVLLVVLLLPTLVMAEGVPVIESTRPNDSALDRISIENTLRPQYTNYTTYNAEGIAGYVYTAPVIPGTSSVNADVVAKPAAPIVVKPISAPAESKAALKRDMPTPPQMGMSIAEQELPTTAILKPGK